MGRGRRYFEAERMYEITLRARAGLPFPTWNLINLLLLSAMARTLRTNYVTLCHYLWMGNHAHILIVVRDAESCRKFYMELQKKITDYLKRLLRKNHLQLWEGEPAVIAILDLDAAIDRVRYLYNNPAQAGLVSDIAEYPGLSSWQDFESCSNSVDTVQSHRVPWVRQYLIPRLPSASLKPREDLQLTETLRHRPRRSHDLLVKPNAWMKCFNIVGEADVRATNARIRAAIARRHSEIARELKAARKEPLGATALRREKIMKAHSPEPRERRIFVISSDSALRVSFIEKVKQIVVECGKLAQLQRQGYRVTWPPGVFPSPLPLCANALAA